MATTPTEALLPSAAAPLPRGAAASSSRPAVMLTATTPATSSSAPAHTADDALALYGALQRCAEEDTKLGRAVAGAVEVLTQALRLYGDEGLFPFRDTRNESFFPPATSDVLNRGEGRAHALPQRPLSRSLAP